MSGEQRRVDDYWQAYWGERFKSENEGYQHRIVALETRAALTDELGKALEQAVEILHSEWCSSNDHAEPCESARTALTRWRAVDGGE